MTEPPTSDSEPSPPSSARGAPHSCTGDRVSGILLRGAAVASHDDPPPSTMSRLSLLVDLSSLLAREVDFDALLRTACDRLALAIGAERASIWLVDAERGDLFTRVAVLPELPGLRMPSGKGIVGFVAERGASVRLDDVRDDPRFDASVDKATGYTTRSMLVCPIREDDESPVRGVIQVLNKQGGVFDEEDERYLLALAAQLARALLMTTLRGGGAPGVILRGPFNKIVGRSAVLSRVYERVTLAAQTDATVLLTGETGTGKGLFARAIHVNSARQSRPFVTVDCTTLPSQLVESELFGHERGAFTGADRRVPGKVELAEGGTLFLDELGELPLDAQAKLLRFLQERTFERVGGRTTLRADLRVVCATNKNLPAEVARGAFRADLYYRVRVVEIRTPTLADRGADEIEGLAHHFAEQYAARYRRPEPSFTSDALRLLRAHRWPGNVRELEHWIESAVALAPDGVIRADLFPHAEAVESTQQAVAGEGTSRPATALVGDGVAIPLGLSLDDASRLYVDATVRACGGNKTEAAKRLGVGRNSVGRWLKDES